jgi:hypothetical protein
MVYVVKDFSKDDFIRVLAMSNPERRKSYRKQHVVHSYESEVRSLVPESQFGDGNKKTGIKDM